MKEVHTLAARTFYQLSTANNTYLVASDIKHSVSHLFSGRCLAECLNHTGMGCIHERETPTLGGEVERLVDMIFKQKIFVGFV